MTVVAGLADPVSNTVLLVADSRVTSLNGCQHFDVCQKVVNLDGDGVFGFSGAIDSAAHIAHWITGTYRHRGVEWLCEESEVIGVLDDIGALRQSERNSFLVAFMDARQSATLVRFSTDGDYNLTRAGIEMIGSGAETYDAIRPMMIDVMNFPKPGLGGTAAVLRALFFSEMVVTEAKARAIDSVGGLMQVFYVERGGPRAVPYWRWVDVDENYGTYVNMDIDESGLWVQTHEQSGLRVPLRFPDEPEFNTADGDFELQSRLSRSSPGVQLRPNPVLVYQPYFDEHGGTKVRISGTD